MAFVLLVFVSLGIFISQGYIFFLSILNSKAYFFFMGVNENAFQSLVKEGLYLVRVLALGLTFSAFVLSFFSMVWIIMKKIEGKILFVFLGLVFISEGLLSYVLSSSIQKIFYLQGIRGMIILIMVLVSAILGRRRKYLFDVKK